MSRIVVALLWLIHWLPLSLQAPIGRAIGLLLYVIIAPRRRVVHTNLRLCFPELPQAERRALAREHFALAGRSLVERGLAWFASAERIRRLVRIEGEARRATAPVRISLIQIGDITDENVRADVVEGDLDISLLGMSYLRRFARGHRVAQREAAELITCGQRRPGLRRR